MSDSLRGSIHVTIKSSDLSSSGEYRFPQPITAKGLKLHTAYIPVIYRTTDANRNTLRVAQLSGVVELPYNIILPEGNFTVNELCVLLQNALTSASSAALWTGTWTVTFNENSSRVTIANSARAFKILDVSKSIHDMLGLPLNLPAQTLTGVKPPNVQSVNLINVVSSTLGNRCQDCLHSSYPNNNSILGTVHMTNPYGTWQSHRWHFDTYQFFDTNQHPITLYGFDLSLLDEQMRPIDFQNQPWYVELSFV